MKTISEVEGELTRLNKQTAELFSNGVSDLRTHMDMDDETLLDWANICLEISAAGWHAWETASLYIRFSASYVRLFGEARLLATGRYGLNLCGDSFEPCIRYFNGILSNLEAGKQNKIDVIETAGTVISARFEQASNLVADFFTTAFAIADAQDVRSLSDWLNIATMSAKHGRKLVLNFFQISKANTDANWSFAEKLFDASVENTLRYIAAQGQLGLKLNGVEREFEKIIEQYAQQNLSIGPWLESLAQVTPKLSSADTRNLVRLTQEIPHPKLAEALTNICEQLPLEKFRILQSWVAEGVKCAGLNFEASLAFFRLESSRSTELLETLLGQVRLSDELRTLQLFSEALVGKRLRLETNTAPDEAYRLLPSSDGESILLPEVVGYYACREDNYRWLKVALCHQLGSYEFGTFEFEYKGSYVAYRDFFHTFEEPELAANLFKILEDGRIDWLLQQHYKGIASDVDRLKQDAISQRRRSQKVDHRNRRHQLTEALLHLTLDCSVFDFVSSGIEDDLQRLSNCLDPLKRPNATVLETIATLADCYRIISVHKNKPAYFGTEHVLYRGIVLLDTIRMNLELASMEETEAELVDEEAGFSLNSTTDVDDFSLDEIKRGDVKDSKAIIVTEQDLDVTEDIEEVEQPGGIREFEELKELRHKPVAETAFKYDEWDFHIDDYRKRWCTLYEIRELEEDSEFVPTTLSQHRSLANQVRKQLNMLRPELLRKVKGMIDGEELDLEKTVEAVVDKKSGISPSENIYIQRQRKDRDVSALFLIDMSASTDDRIADPEAESASPQNLGEDDFYQDYIDVEQANADPRKKIIDLEKESVVLMAEALQGLGDSYAVCGFSGYGKDRVEYFICKDFDDAYDHRVKAKIGGIKPCRSTRMGPAIRHATQMLAATESRVKALIIISDGYPQDFDYGTDRNSRDYGIKDTTKALTEANQKGVQSFCLTVDPSGHDYLREMCPDQQYMVMQEIIQLPSELSKIYRSLTT